MSVYVRLSDFTSDRTKYDQGRKRSGKSRTLMRQPILAIDGEGVTDANGDHRYTLLAASNDEYISAHRLSSRACFDFLLSLPKRHLVVGFSINYDICKWLNDLPMRYLGKLWRLGFVTWEGYHIRWAPTKQITIRKEKQSIHIYDVFGFYQRSFVAALREWNVGTPEQVARIESMKTSRSEFSDESFDEILSYCQEECALLVTLVQKLREAMIEGEIPLEQWYGAGAIAAAIMKKEGVKAYIKRQPPLSWSIPVMSAYFGGRFELALAGIHQNVYTYDIRSAYPYILTSLPCQTHMTYEHHMGYVPTEWGVYRVAWSVPEDTLYPPFPFRHERTRQIYYPLSGEGYYHASEVRSAMLAYPESVHILETYKIVTHCGGVGCSGRPFAFIPKYFRYRSELKKRGSQAQLTIKLGLNSLYGKTAQGVGWGEKKPPFQSYLWAGMITAGTRAMLLEAINKAPNEILWTATDGVVSRVPLDLPCGDALGEWENGVADEVFSVQSGVYQVRKGDSVEIRSRGFGKRDVDFEVLKELYNQDSMAEYEYAPWRFIGLGSALMRKEFRAWFGKWKKIPRQIHFSQTKRFPDDLIAGRWLPPSDVAGQDESAPFEPRASWVDLWDRESSDESFGELNDTEQP